MFQNRFKTRESVSTCVAHCVTRQGDSCSSALDAMETEEGSTVCADGLDGPTERRHPAIACCRSRDAAAPLLWSSVQLCASICSPLEPLLRASHTSSQRSYGFTGRLAALPRYLISSIWSVWVTLRLFAQLLGNITLRHYTHNYVQLYETNLFYLMRIP